MKPKYHKHIFICTNDRGPNHPRGDCANCGGNEIRMRFVKLINQNGLKGKVRANKSGCLDVCEFGPIIVIYPQNIWYTGITIEDVDEIFEKSIIGDGIVDRIASSKETWDSLDQLRLEK